MAEMRLRMVVDHAQVKQGFLAHVATQLNLVAPRIMAGVRRRVGDELYRAVFVSDEAQSLMGGSLHGQLGVVNPSDAIAEVATTLVQNMEVRLTPFYARGDGLGGGISVYIMRSDMADLLSLPSGSFTSENGFIVTWLKWLLTAGDRIVVSDHRFGRGGGIHSRTGSGIMRRKGKWSVPPEFSGTAASNWLTRVLDDFGDNVGRILEDEFIRAIN